nr:MAG TPA: L alanyl D glutamate peptidase endolysin [Caudoviricetes sp.]
MASNFKFGKRSLDNLRGVHPDLVKVANRALELSPIDFTITEGLRTVARQKELVAKGLSKTMNSRHITGHAVDIVPLPVDWNNAQPFVEVSKYFFQAARELGVAIRWGGDWNENGDWKDEKFRDLPHYELKRSVYP